MHYPGQQGKKESRQGGGKDHHPHLSAGMRLFLHQHHGGKVDHIGRQEGDEPGYDKDAQRSLLRERK
jgi:hypothetical protein